MSKTYGEQFKDALKCTTKEEAMAWLDKEVAEICADPEVTKTPDEMRKIVLSNLGYMAGYYDRETAQKIYDLFGAVHPVFGAPGYHDTVTPAQAFEAGRKHAEGCK